MRVRRLALVMSVAVALLAVPSLARAESPVLAAGGRITFACGLWRPAPDSTESTVGCAVTEDIVTTETFYSYRSILTYRSCGTEVGCVPEYRMIRMGPTDVAAVIPIVGSALVRSTADGCTLNLDLTSTDPASGSSVEPLAFHRGDWSGVTLAGIVTTDHRATGSGETCISSYTNGPVNAARVFSFDLAVAHVGNRPSWDADEGDGDVGTFAADLIAYLTR